MFFNPMPLFPHLIDLGKYRLWFFLKAAAICMTKAEYALVRVEENAQMTPAPLTKLPAQAHQVFWWAAARYARQCVALA